MLNRCVAIIPIKSNSQRVMGKNFRLLGGRPLFEHILDHAREAGCFDAIFVDTDSSLVKTYAQEHGIGIIDRVPWLATDEANGNDLLVHALEMCPGYASYVQLFATAPFLKAESISAAVKTLWQSNEHDSVFTATESRGWYWRDGIPVNYRPGILPRSQDISGLIKETTGLYGIRAEALIRYRCRIGRTPFVYLVSSQEAIDLDTEEDFRYAEYVYEHAYAHASTHSYI